MKIFEQINTFERLDLLIRMKNTGNLNELASRLNLSVSTIKRNIEAMRELGAPIVYNHFRKSYVYEYSVYFVHGFVEESKYKKYTEDN